VDDGDVADGGDVADDGDAADDGDVGGMVLVCFEPTEGEDGAVVVVEVVFNEIVDDVEVNKTVRSVVSNVVPHP
jgi:hypothetical protein